MPQQVNYFEATNFTLNLSSDRQKRELDKCDDLRWKLFNWREKSQTPLPHCQPAVKTSQRPPTSSSLKQSHGTPDYPGPTLCLKEVAAFWYIRNIRDVFLEFLVTGLMRVQVERFHFCGSSSTPSTLCSVESWQESNVLRKGLKTSSSFSRFLKYYPWSFSHKYLNHYNFFFFFFFLLYRIK